MGAEFLLYSLPWTQLDEPRQKLLHDTIDRLTDEQLENLVEAIGAFEEEELSEVRTAIHEAVDEYLDLDDCRDATTWRCGSEPITRVFTGGLSWGDAPTECCQNFNIIANCEPIFDLIERWARKDSPASAADTSRPFDIFDDVTAALETCLAHFGKQMPPDDRVQRERLAASARTLLRSQSNMLSSVGEVDAQVPSSLRDILQEFCGDVEAAGRDQVAEDWPDLVTEEHQGAVDAINRRPGCIAALTGQRHLENYIHPEALRRVRGLHVTYGPDDDVAELVAQRTYDLLGGTHPWQTIPSRKRRQMKHRAKRWLNTEVVDAMTPALLAEQDPAGDVRSWLEAIQWLIDERD